MRLGVWFALFMMAAAGAEAACVKPTGYDGPDLQFRVDVPKPVYRHDLGRAKISEMHRDVGAEAGVGTVGLTLNAFALRISTEGEWVDPPEGGSCFWPGRVEVVLSIPQMMVFLAAEYPEGSCQYNAILEHENEHVRTNLEVLERHGPKIEAAARRAVAGIVPFPAAFRMTGRQMSEVLQKRINPAVDALDAERVKLNLALDTPENYERIAARCTGW